jgi:hypothetical protein
MELQPQRSDPGAQGLAPTLTLGQHALAQAQSMLARLLQPARPRDLIRILHHPEDGSPHSGYAAKTQRGQGQAVQARRLVDPVVDPGRGVHRREQVGRLAGEELVQPPPSSCSSKAKPGISTRSRKPFISAGIVPHHVGKTNTMCSAQATSSGASRMGG